MLLADPRGELCLVAASTEAVRVLELFQPAERLGLDLDQAFTLLRDYARDRNRRLSALARDVIDGTQQTSPPSPHQPPELTKKRSRNISG